MKLCLSFTPNDIRSDIAKIIEDLRWLAEWSGKHSLLLKAMITKYIVLGSRYQVLKISADHSNFFENSVQEGRVSVARNLEV